MPRPPRLVVETREVDRVDDLISFTSADQPLAWLRRGDGIVGIGRAVASDQDFKYGESIAALGATGAVWDEASVAAYVADELGLDTFFAEVRPEELARRLGREMDEHRTVSLSRTYAPHEYVVHLSPADRERFAGIEREVTQELSAYLLEHARAERLALVATPVIELRTDPRYGKFFEHKPASAKVKITRKRGQIHVEIEDFVSPTIIERLAQQSGVLKPQIEDWRAMVDVVLVDTAYDGEVFNIALSDVPERKDDLVLGRYELPAPVGPTTVAVKIVDMLGEEVLVSATI